MLVGPMNPLKLALLLGMFTSSAQAILIGDNLLLNGGFESGDFSNWIHTSNGEISNQAHTGNFAAVFGGDATTFGNIIQGAELTGSSDYFLSFYLRNDGPGPSLFQAYVNGFIALSLNNSAPFDYTLFSINVGSAQRREPIDFFFQPAGHFYIDDISLATHGVPEGGSTLLLLGGLVIAECLRRLLYGPVHS